jgi:cytochrome c7-like protein
MFKHESAKKPRVLKQAAVFVMGFAGFLTPQLVSKAVAQSGAAGLQPKVQDRRQQRTTKLPTGKKPSINYAWFSHSTHVSQQKLSCDSCHKFPTKNWKDVRKGDAAFADVAEFPEHSSCLNCHRPQFFARERPAPAICSNCHVNVTPRDTSRFLFPSLGDISDPSKQKRDVVREFVINFPHDKHLDVVEFNPSSPLPRNSGFIMVSWQEKPKVTTEPKSCPVCHQTYQPQGNSSDEYVSKPPKNLGDAFWLKKGTFKTIPNSHTVCFSCHNADLGIEPAPAACNACHKLAAPPTVLKTDFDPKLAETIGVTDKVVLTAWRRRVSAGAFRHEGGEHPNLSCVNCHNVPIMNTVDIKSLVVPVRSCGGAEGCHVTATADDGGILNYEVDQKKAKAGFVCTKCHLSYGAEPAPASHLAVIPEAKK